MTHTTVLFKQKGILRVKRPTHQLIKVARPIKVTYRVGTISACNLDGISPYSQAFTSKRCGLPAADSQLAKFLDLGEKMVNFSRFREISMRFSLNRGKTGPAGGFESPTIGIAGRKLSIHRPIFTSSAMITCCCASLRDSDFAPLGMANARGNRFLLRVVPIGEFLHFEQKCPTDRNCTTDCSP